MSDWRAPVMAAPCYRDPRAARAWLEKAFGFETFMMIEDQNGALVHCEMRFRSCVIMVGTEWDDAYRSPASLGGKVTSSVHVALEADVDAHCEHVRASGGVILTEPADQFYGDRTYRCADPEGHIWTFSQPVRATTREEAEAAMGGALKITGWL